MSLGYLSNPVVFLIEMFFKLYINAVLLRFLFQLCRADFYNPFSQFLVKITQLPLKILRSFIPSIGRIDTASIVLMLILEVMLILLSSNFDLQSLNIVVVLMFSVIELVKELFDILEYAVIGRVLLSWINPNTFNAFSSLLWSITEPLFRICRQFIPNLGMIDLSPMIILLGIQLVKMIVFPPIYDLLSLLS